jgi:hypothetical protein
MQSDTQLMPTSYLHNVLLDGAKPFLYRSSVRSLLGIPDSGGSEIAFSHTMPPIGFTYPNSQFMGESYVSYHSSDLTVSSAVGTQGIDLEGYEEIVAKDAQQYMPPQVQSERIAHSISQAKENGETKVMPKGIAQSSTAMPEPDQKNVTRPVPVSGQEKSPVEVSERPGTVFEPATIDIPGASKRIQNFPALSLSEQREPFSNMVEVQSQPPLSPKDSRPSSVARLLYEGSGISAPPPLQGEGRDGGRRSDEAFCQSSAALSFNPNPNPNPNPPREREFTWLVNRLPTMREHLGSEGQENELSSAPTIKAEHSSERVTQIDPGTGNGASRAADRIEQLRNAVHELATKQSPPREQTRDEAQLQQQQLPPPVQQVVIVRRPASQARIPQAFWERSYLGRMRIRILR